MKKILTIFGIMLITLFALTINAYAYNYSVNLQPAKTELKPGDTVTVDIMISSLALEENEAGIIGFEAGLNYESAIFSKASVGGNGQWSQGENITKVKGIFFSNEVKESGKLATITLTVAENAEVGEAVVTLNNIKTANGTSDEITTSDASVKFEIVEVENPNDNNNEDENDNNVDNEENKNDEGNVKDNNDQEADKNDNEENNDNLNKEENKDANKEENKNNTVDKNSTTNKNNTSKDNTIANKVISAAGLEDISAMVVGALVVIAGISYMSYKKYKNM